MQFSWKALDSVPHKGKEGKKKEKEMAFRGSGHLPLKDYLPLKALKDCSSGQGHWSGDAAAQPRC